MRETLDEIELRHIEKEAWENYNRHVSDIAICRSIIADIQDRMQRSFDKLEQGRLYEDLRKHFALLDLFLKPNWEP